MYFVQTPELLLEKSRNAEKSQVSCDYSTKYTVREIIEWRGKRVIYIVYLFFFSIFCIECDEYIPTVELYNTKIYILYADVPTTRLTIHAKNAAGNYWGQDFRILGASNYGFFLPLWLLLFSLLQQNPSTTGRISWMPYGEVDKFYFPLSQKLDTKPIRRETNCWLQFIR